MATAPNLLATTSDQRQDWHQRSDLRYSVIYSSRAVLQMSTTYNIISSNFNMKITLVVLASLTTALALPVPVPAKDPAGKGTCTFSINEKSNLGHNHDVNTGMIKVGGKVIDSHIAVFGSGCSPAWAVGGAIDDNTPTPTPKKSRGSF
ncbi:hypothetical protein FKW77_005704 [Venturia effusa]|uniref:Uncharacterized protein n=1 Tax=Venturia effusa TaxID=50376 RepID=A0A517L3B7_9PEZI|nr:hypothetical protein FKW77_005704 [Venturia effusa]